MKTVVRISPSLGFYCTSAHALSYSTGASKKQSFTINYPISKCGFTSEYALEASKQVLFIVRPDSVLAFFRNLGFSDSHIHIIIKREPRLLLSDPTKTLLPKVDFFESKGASRFQLAAIFTGSPHILLRSLRNHIIPSYDFLKRFLHTDKRTIICINRCTEVLCKNSLKNNVKFLVDYGLPELSIARSLNTWPQMFNYDVDKFKKAVEELKELGHDPSKSAFVTAYYASNVISNTLRKRKVELYKRWGWSDDAINSAFVKYPFLILFSERKIMAAMDFYFNCLGWDCAVIAKNPSLLGLSLEKRIIPRASVLQFLHARGLIKNASIVLPYYFTEKVFLQKYVNAFKDDTTQLLNLYKEKMNLSRE